MAEKVEKMGIKRESGFLYFLRGTDVYKTPMKRAGMPSPVGKAHKVSNGSFKREDGYLYFLDSHGDVSRAKRAVGGQKRKKPAAKTAMDKKPTKAVSMAKSMKPAAKSTAKKTTTSKTIAKKK